MAISRMIAQVAVGVSLIAAAPAAATEAARSEPTKAADQKTDAKGERLICKRFDSTESRMKSFKACHTAEEWKKIDRDSY